MFRCGFLACLVACSCGVSAAADSSPAAPTLEQYDSDLDDLQEQFDRERDQLKKRIARLDAFFSKNATQARDRALASLRELQNSILQGDKMGADDAATIAALQEAIETLKAAPQALPKKKRLETLKSDSIRVLRARIESQDRELDEAYGTNQELVRNPGFEIDAKVGQTPEWARVRGDWNAAPPEHVREKRPSEGKRFFFAGASSRAVLQQEIDLSTAGRIIDRGAVAFRAACDVMCHRQKSKNWDTCEMKIEFFDASGKAIRSYSTGVLTSIGKWSRKRVTQPVPHTARKAVVSLIARRNGPTATWNDGYFDNVSFRLTRVQQP